MSYQNLYEIIRFCNKYDIKLSIKAIKRLKQIEFFPKKLYFLLVLDIEMVEVLLKKNFDIKTLIFMAKLIHTKEDFDLLMELITMSRCSNYSNIFYAFRIKEIREDEEALKLIASQESYIKQFIVLSACRNEYIRTNKDLLNQIASCDTWEEQEALRVHYLEESMVTVLEDSQIVSSEEKILLDEEIISENIEENVNTVCELPMGEIQTLALARVLS